MSEALKTLLASDAPAARDAGFEIAVLARIEQRRFQRGLAANVALAALATILLAWVMPGLQPLWDAGLAASNHILSTGPANLALGIVLMAISLALPLWRRTD